MTRFIPTPSWLNFCILVALAVIVAHMFWPSLILKIVYCGALILAPIHVKGFWHNFLYIGGGVGMGLMYMSFEYKIAAAQALQQCAETLLVCP